MSVIQSIQKKAQESGKQAMKNIHSIKLPEILKSYAQQYSSHGDEIRTLFLWKWVYIASKKLTWSSVKDNNKETVAIARTLSVILVGLLDDIADKEKNQELINDLEIYLFSKNKLIEQSIEKKWSTQLLKIQFGKKIWTTIHEILNKLPKYNEYEKLLLYDFQQMINAVRYSAFINANPQYINNTESYIYLPFNMMVMVSSDIDLMGSPNFNTNELSPFRELVYQVQLMTRIGNWVSTWERELNEKDYSSAIFSQARSQEIINTGDLIKHKKDIIKNKINNAGLEKQFYKKWQSLYDDLSNYQQIVPSVAIDKMKESLKEIMFMHLASRGLK